MEDPTRRKETRMESGIQIEEGQRKRDLKHSPGAKSEANLAVLGAWSLWSSPYVGKMQDQPDSLKRAPCSYCSIRHDDARGI